MPISVVMLLRLGVRTTLLVSYLADTIRRNANMNIKMREEGTPKHTFKYEELMSIFQRPIHETH
jgi:hypothetical protein